jgi:hypothetical protein
MDTPTTYKAQLNRRPVALVAVMLIGCAYRLPALDARIEALPQRLSEAGLYCDDKMSVPSGELLAYAPSFELWSDGAKKLRWIRLPAGTQIDTANVDDWSFPLGTELWKEFRVDGRRIETRLLRRVSPSTDGWIGVSYVWNSEQTDASIITNGVENALGTTHDVPDSRACMTCHGGRASIVLGFSAVQLARPARTGEATLDSLSANGRLSSPMKSPVFGGSTSEIAALGYLHSNCGSCHNDARSAANTAFRPPRNLDLWLTVSTLGNPSATPTYKTAMDRFIHRGSPEESPIIQRLTHAPFMRRRMPPIAVERPDNEGAELLRQWIRSLPSRANE